MIVFENRGEIDPTLIRTFGANVKESDSPIGYFGTGMKYAIAVLMRENQYVAVLSGGSVYDFDIQHKEIRGKSFELVTMNGEEIGFTTELGKNWEVWMAYRELYCNMLDESGRVYEADELPLPEHGVTRVAVDGMAFKLAHRRRSEFILDTDALVLAHASRVEAYDKPSAFIYYRGIRVGELPMVSKFTYNLLDEVTLTEDRTVRYPWSVQGDIGATIVASTDEKFIRRALTTGDGYYEHRAPFGSVKPSEAFMTVVKGLFARETTKLPKGALDLFRKFDLEKNGPTPLDMNEIEKQQLDEALAFCELIGHPITCEVKICDALGPGVYGMMHDSVLYVSRLAFQNGTKIVAGTLIEEQVHAVTGFQDETRALQDHFLNLLVSLGERFVGGPL